MSENEIKELKEQLKKELLAEINAKKENENVWKRIKEEYEDEFSKFDFVDHWEFINSENELIVRDTPVSARYPLQNAIGTLLRISNKAKTVSKMNITYEEAKDIVEKILNILKEKTIKEESYELSR